MKLEIQVDNKTQSITSFKFSEDFNIDPIGVLERFKFILLTPPSKEETIKKPTSKQIKELIN